MITVPSNERSRLTHWREYIRVLIRMDPECYPAELGTAVANLSAKAHGLYPKVEAGKQVAMNIADMGEEPMRRLPEPSLMHFLMETGSLLFAGMDGPLRTGEQMIAEIDEIAADERTH